MQRGVASLVVAVLVTACSATDQRAEFCEAVAQLDRIDAISMEVSLSDDPSVRAALAQTTAQAEGVARMAPIEIRADGELIATFLAALTQAFKSTKFNEPLERSAAIGAIQQQFEGALATSVSNIANHTAKACSPSPARINS